MEARSIAQAKIEAKADMYKALREFGIKLNPNDAAESAVLESKGYFPKLGIEKIDHPAFDGYWFDKDVRDIVNRVAGMTNDETIDGVKGVIGNYMAWWKGMALMGPMTKIRNFVDNQFTGILNHGLGWLDIKKYDMPSLAGTTYALAKGDLHSAFKELGEKGVMFERQLRKDIGGGMTVADLANYARQHGLITERTMGHDVPTAVAEAISGQKSTLAPWSPRFALFDLSHKVDALTENHSKFKSFIMNYETNIKAGLGKDESLKYALIDSKKAFVDYSDLTNAERKYLKNLIPFYTFMRKNMANKLQGFFMHPEMYSLLPKLEEMVENDNPNYDKKLIPEYMKNLGMFPVGETDKGFLMMNPGLSIQNMNMLPLRFTEGQMMPEISLEDLKNDIVQSANPAIKTIVEMIPDKGYDTFRRKDLAETAKAPYTLRFFAQSPQVMQFIDGAMRMGGWDEGIKVYLDNDGKMQIDAKIARVMESMLPVLKHIDNVILGGAVAGEALIPGVEKALGEFSTAKSDYEGLEKFLQVLAYSTGLKFKEIDVKRLKEDLRKDIYYGAREQRSSDMRFDEKAVRRKEVYRQREDRVMRRLGL
jgi:hypothetical protein